MIISTKSKKYRSTDPENKKKKRKLNKPGASNEVSETFQTASNMVRTLNELNDDVLGVITNFIPEEQSQNVALGSPDLARAIAMSGRPITRPCTQRIDTFAKFLSQKSAMRTEINLFRCLADPQTETRTRQRQLGHVYEWIKSLKELDLEHNVLDSDELSFLAEAIGQSKKLTYLNLANNTLCEYENIFNTKGITDLAEALKVNTSLTECVLRDSGLYVDGWRIIFNALRDSPESKITRWNLSDEWLGPGIAKPLAEYISVSASLTELDLFGNDMGEDGGTAIAESLLTNRSLLTLKSNHLGSKGAKVMGEVLKVNNILRTLEAPHNSIDIEGAKAIAEGLSVNTVMTALDLSFNNLRPTGAAIIAEALKSGRTVLTSLNLSQNALCGINHFGNGTYDASGINALAAALASNAVLTKLDVSDNFVGDEGEKVLRDAIEGRESFQLFL
jgi:hypothetical protein